MLRLYVLRRRGRKEVKRVGTRAGVNKEAVVSMAVFEKLRLLVAELLAQINAIPFHKIVWLA